MLLGTLKKLKTDLNLRYISHLAYVHSNVLDETINSPNYRNYVRHSQIDEPIQQTTEETAC
jgi:hypothetical protein